MSVRLKLTLVNLFIVAIVGAVIATILLVDARSNMLEEKRLRANELLRNLVTINRENVILEDKFALTTAAKRFLDNQDVLFLAVDYGDSERIFATEEVDGDRLEQLSDEMPVSFEYEGQDVLIFREPVEIKGRTFGKFTLGLSLKTLQKQIREQAKNVGVVAILVVLMFMLLASLINRAIIRPIDTISEFAGELGEGQLGRTIEIGRRDEFGHLADVMSSMSRQLLEAQDELVANERLAQELDIARNIQTQYLPKEELELSNLNYEVYFLPAKEVGGDAYDYIRLADGRVAFLVADVSGKGIEGALGMITTSALFRSAVLRGVTDPLQILDEVNEGLHDRLPGTMFVTAALIVYDEQARNVALVSAGHPEVFRFGNDKYEDLTGEETGVPLGIAESELWRTRTVKKVYDLDPGDGVIIYTDGITETFDENKDKIYGDERVEHFIREHSNMNAPSIVSSLVKTLEEFRGNREDDRDDDMTILAIKTV